MNPIDQIMIEAEERGVFPGAVLLFSKGEQIFQKSVYGYASLKPEKRFTAIEMLYDVASLTKVFATTSIAMRLCERGVLDLTEKLGKILKSFAESPYAEVTVEQLLMHKSGMPAYRPYYEQFDPDQVERENIFERRDKYLKWIAEEPPEAKPGSQYLYSDLDFIVLGAILEDNGRQNLQTLFREQVLRPMGIYHTFYSPVSSGEMPVAPTEQNAWRRRILCGEVHDENAFVLGGAAGHAGVFTCVEDCHKFAREIVAAFKGRSSWIKSETAKQFIGEDKEVCLGWDRPSRPVSQAGRYFPETAVGHLGFTGCSLWIDLDAEVIAILLTNSIHPSCDNEKIKEFRPRLHDALFEYYLEGVEV